MQLLSTDQPSIAKNLFSSWVLAAFAFILFSIIATFTLQSTKYQTQQMAKLLTDRGTIIIWSIESAARTILGKTERANIPRPLFTEIARQPEVDYLTIINGEGTILVHNNSELVGTTLYTADELTLLAPDDLSQSRIVEKGHKKSFEVYKYFTPPHVIRPPRMGHMRMMGGLHMQQEQDHLQTSSNSIKIERPANENDKLIIFVGLTMAPFEQILNSEHEDTLITSLLVGVLGLAGILIIFLAQKYRVSRQILYDTQQLSSKVITSLPLGLFAIDNKGRITLFNNNLLALFKTDAKTLKNSLLANHTQANWQEFIAELEEKQGLLEKEISFARSKTEQIPMNLYASKMMNESGALIGYLFMLHDVSEVKLLEEQLRRNERLSALGKMAAGVAHEIRNPLSSIKGFATFISNKTPAESSAHTTAQLLIQEVERLNRVVTELLAFAKPSELLLTSTRIEQVIERVYRLAESDAVSKHVHIITRFAKDLPTVSIDQERITQALLNLILNAIHASKQGDSMIITAQHIASAVKNIPAEICIAIHDTGSGIQPSNLKQIFTPYFTTKTEGTGLGLSITSNIIEKHNGRITVESTINQGTTFTICLPIEHKENKI